MHDFSRINRFIFNQQTQSKYYFAQMAATFTSGKTLLDTCKFSSLFCFSLNVLTAPQIVLPTCCLQFIRSIWTLEEYREEEHKVSLSVSWLPDILATCQCSLELICFDNSICHTTEIEAADQTSYLKPVRAH